MSRTLVLNASMEALCVVPLGRAVVMMVGGRAELVAQSGDKMLRSPSVSIPYPAVVRLKTYVKVPYRVRAPLTRQTLLARDRHICGYCGRHATTIDHIKPKAHGGRHEWTNVAAACRRCNAHKADRTPEQAGMILAITPTVPAGPGALAVAVGRLEDEWEPYFASV